MATPKKINGPGKESTQIAERPANAGRKTNLAAREAFAQAVVAGKDYRAAYAIARPESKGSPLTQARRGSIWAKEPWVMARVEELRKQTVAMATEKTAIDKAWVLTRLSRIVERSMQAEPVLGPENVPTGEYVFNAAGANRALELIGKELGMFVDRKEIRSGPLESMSDEELEGLLAEARQAASAASPGASSTVQ